MGTVSLVGGCRLEDGGCDGLVNHHRRVWNNGSGVYRDGHIRRNLFLRGGVPGSCADVPGDADEALLLKIS